MKTLILSLSAGLLLFAAQGAAEAGAYIKFDGVDGEAINPNDSSSGWSELKTVGYKITRPGSGLTGATRRAGSPVFEDITCEMVYDKASPKIAEALLRGLVIPTIEIVVLDDATNEVMLQIEVSNGAISSTETKVETEPKTLMTSNFSLNFEQIKVTYTAINGDKKKVEYSWKVEEGES